MCYVNGGFVLRSRSVGLYVDEFIYGLFFGTYDGGGSRRSVSRILGEGLVEIVTEGFLGMVSIK